MNLSQPVPDYIAIPFTILMIVLIIVILLKSQDIVIRGLLKKDKLGFQNLEKYITFKSKGEKQ